jgi:hypothetical protein
MVILKEKKRLSERDPNVTNAKGVDTLRWYVPLEIREWLIYVRKTWCLMMLKLTRKKTISKKKLIPRKNNYKPLIYPFV